MVMPVQWCSQLAICSRHCNSNKETGLFSSESTAPAQNRRLPHSPPARFCHWIKPGATGTSVIMLWAEALPLSQDCVSTASISSSGTTAHLNGHDLVVQYIWGRWKFLMLCKTLRNMDVVAFTVRERLSISAKIIWWKVMEKSHRERNSKV